MEKGFAGTYGVELMFEEPPEVDKAAVLRGLRKRSGRVEPLDGDEQSGILSFLHLDYPISYADGSAPAQCFMAVSEAGVDVQKLEPALQQSRDWPEARASVARTRSTMLVTDLMSRGLEYKLRLELFHNALVSVLEVVPCIAISWQPSGRIVDPAVYLESRRGDQIDPIFPAVTVRLFRVENRVPGETVMDTLGLAALGVPDLQCHFVGLDPDAVASMLYNRAAYLFEQGDIIQDGQTVQGFRLEHRWVCRHETSLVEPERVVLDIDPGSPHAAGNRSGNA